MMIGWVRKRTEQKGEDGREKCESFPSSNLWHADHFGVHCIAPAEPAGEPELRWLGHIQAGESFILWVRSPGAGVGGRQCRSFDFAPLRMTLFVSWRRRDEALWGRCHSVDTAKIRARAR